MTFHICSKQPVGQYAVDDQPYAGVDDNVAGEKAIMDRQTTPYYWGPFQYPGGERFISLLNSTLVILQALLLCRQALEWLAPLLFMWVERGVSREIYLNRAQLSRLPRSWLMSNLSKHTHASGTLGKTPHNCTHTHKHIDSTLSFNLSLSLARSFSLSLLFRVSHTLSPILAFLVSFTTFVEQLGATLWPEAFRRRERTRAATPMVAILIMSTLWGAGQ